MTDEEFEIIDELYFVTSYTDLKVETEMSDDLLEKQLASLISKGWIKVYESVDEEVTFDPDSFQLNFKNYFYLASKKGLFQHNSQ